MKDSKLYGFVRPILTLLVRIIYRPKVIGKEYIPSSGSIIFAGNHTNIFDCLLLAHCTKRHVHYLAKDELFKGFKKIFFANLGLIPVNRREKSKDSLKLAKKYLKAGKIIGIFPEGTISKTKDLLPFKIGAVKMAKDTNTKIIPFGISGEYKLFSKDLKITFGKPIEIKDDLDKENDKLKSIIEDLRRR